MDIFIPHEYKILYQPKRCRKINYDFSRSRYKKYCTLLPSSLMYRKQETAVSRKCQFPILIALNTICC